MTISNVSNCPDCGGERKRYDKVLRTVREKGGQKIQVTIHRLQCTVCRKIRRVLPDNILPHKQYHRAIINGVLNGTITPNVIEYEDYPCEVTMRRWTRNLQAPL